GSAERASVSIRQQAKGQDENSVLRQLQSVGMRAAHGAGALALAQFRGRPRAVDEGRVCAAAGRQRPEANREAQVVPARGGRGTRTGTKKRMNTDDFLTYPQENLLQKK